MSKKLGFRTDVVRLEMMDVLSIVEAERGCKEVSGRQR